MKAISEDEILRMTGNRGGSGTVGRGSGGNLAGYATQAWTEEYYINKEFFSSLFKVYDVNNNEIIPNDTDSTIDNIKAMFGFWTDFYVSALGTGGQQSVDLRLAQLADVNVAGVTNGQVLTYDTTTGKWIASTPQSGTDMATVWSNLAANGNQQIDYSHLSGAVSLSNGTITIGSSSITPITSHQSLAGYATEQWVGLYYLPLTGGTITGSLTVNGTFDNKGGVAYIRNAANNTVRLVFDQTGLYWCNIALRYVNGIGQFYFYESNSDGNPAYVNVGNLYSYGYVSALSDARKKNLKGDIELTVDQIAKAPAIKFTWKDKKKPGLFAGSLAQYWQKTLPEVVQDHDGTLTLDYQVTALMAAIVTARKVEDHESRLRRLEKMFALNENDIED
jgi:hypothetical protein